MNNCASAALGTPVIAPVGGVVFARALRQRGVNWTGADHRNAKRIDTDGVIAMTTVRAGVDLTVDVPGARAWSPPV